MSVGHLERFDPEKGSWQEWVEILDHYFVANKIEGDARKRSALLSACGTSAYRVIRDKCQPDLPGTKGFAYLKDVLNNYYTPKKSMRVARLEFSNTNRRPGQSVAAYIAELRKLTEHCQYKVEDLPDRLCDRLIGGINEDDIQAKLLENGDEITFEQAEKIALNIEASKKHLQDIKQASALKTDPGTVNKLSKPHTQESVKECFRCGDRHDPTTCQFRNSICHKCGRRGHIRSKCPPHHTSYSASGRKGGQKKKPSGSNSAGRRKFRSTHYLEGEDTQEDILQEELFALNTL